MERVIFEERKYWWDIGTCMILLYLRNEKVVMRGLHFDRLVLVLFCLWRFLDHLIILECPI